jgi:hypothetical protein
MMETTKNIRWAMTDANCVLGSAPVDDSLSNSVEAGLWWKALSMRPLLRQEAIRH